MCALTSYNGLRLLGSCIFLSRLTSAPILKTPAISSSPSFFKFHGLALMENSHRNSSSFSARSRSGGGRGSEMKDERLRSVGGRGGNSKDKIDALGKLLTRVLRHMASELSLDMRSDGYVRVGDLLKLNLKTFANIPLKSHSVEDIREAVRKDNKQRFGLLEENGELLIRANQGHTVATIETESLLKPILSPEEAPVCVHGTYRRNLDSILQCGLKRMKRLHVHFSSGLPTDGAVISGMRRDVNILIFLDVRKALQDGMKLYMSENKVILTEGFDGVVPVKYFDRIETWPGKLCFVGKHEGDSTAIGAYGAGRVESLGILDSKRLILWWGSLDGKSTVWFL